MLSDLNYNLYALVLITSGAFAFLLAAWIMRKRRQVFNWFSIMLIAAAWWAVAYGFELSSTSMENMLFWIKFEYLGIACLPSLWLIFCYSFIGRDNRLNNLTFFSLFAYSAVTYLMMLTNEGHHLFYESTSVDYSGPFPLLSIDPGPWYHLHTIVFYSLVVAGYWALIAHLRHTKPVFRKQNRLLILSTLVPLSVNFGYIFLDLRPYGHLDLTPFAFLLTSFIIAVGLMRFGLFDVTPMARTRVIQELSDGVAVVDSHGRLIDFNGAFEEIMKPREDLFGKRLTECFPAKDMDQAFPDLGEENLQGHILHLNDGRIYEVSSTILYEKTGLFNGSAVLIKDVTQRIESQHKLEDKTKQLTELNALKDRLFGIIAHDLRGPLINLQETLNLVNSDVISTEERDEILKILGENVEQSVSLMKNLLDWAQSQQKGERLELSLFHVESLVREAVEPLQSLLKRKQQVLELDVSSQLEVYADRERIKIVLRNLVNNSIKFTPVQGKIRVWTEQVQDDVWFFVRDNGVGMSESQLEKLNKEMELESTYGTQNEKGSGLGLMLCRDFLRQHGSKWEVESEMGFGSTFSFSLSALPKDSHPADSDLYKYQ
ncbi:sensor histidine kinase [Croceimicrobium hydrocarbonivorans]|uniref:histidine kinase n=1 Tax=Croceimicrobium hydrocarbonivorans TaxID=2761580 RepID=A0A7H0VAX7_9FLAO|nr:histidine kinase N-terminal 7TM domain-containing protein [Croceimicrobium hydrocarbonivorans]QNR22875.1 PAS domain-containing protein [Croceimicrobium hydrocarbonivorans]